jgi:hypothetical protein
MRRAQIQFYCFIKVCDGFFDYQTPGVNAVFIAMTTLVANTFKRGLRWFGLLLLLSQAAWAGSSLAVEFPFKLRAGLIWVQVDGPRGETPLHFILDSGAEASVIDLATARRLHLALGQPVTVRGINDTTSGYWTDSLRAQMGGVSLSTKYLAMDLSALSAACHREVDGLIGADFFAGRVVQIDFAKEKVRLLESCRPGLKDEVLPLQVQAARLRVPVEVMGFGKGWARLDTGCASALHWAVSAAALNQEGTSQELGVGVTSVVIHHNTQTVRLGGLTLERVSTGLHAEKLLAGEDGLLGAGLLSHFAVVTIDEPDGQLILESFSNPKPSNRR